MTDQNANIPPGRDDSRLRQMQLSVKPIAYLITIISAIAGIISIIVVASVVILAITGNVIPPELGNWGGIILGFYFGQFATLVKDYMNLVLISPLPAERDERTRNVPDTGGMQ